MQISIKIIGDGSVSYCSSSNGASIISASDTNGSGIYVDGYNYKFNINKKHLHINVITGSISSASIDRSFTISGSNTTASLEVIFYPVKTFESILNKKDDVLSHESAISINTPSRLVSSTAIDSTVFQSGITLPTTEDYKNGYMTRYFYRQTNNISSHVKEINFKQYQLISQNFLYTTLKILWKISGNESDVLVANRNIMHNADAELSGIKYVLQRNLLQYYRQN